MQATKTTPTHTASAAHGKVPQQNHMQRSKIDTQAELKATSTPDTGLARHQGFELWHTFGNTA